MGVISLSYPNRRKSVPLLADLEGRGPLGGGGSPVWLPYTFSACSSTVQGTHPLDFLFHTFHQGDCSGGCISISFRDRGGRPSSSSFSGLLQPDVRHWEDLRVMETSDRPLGLHSLCFTDSLQQGDQSVSSFLSSSGQLDGLRRSQGSILASPCPPGQSQVPAVCGLRRALPVSGSLLRPLHDSPCLHQGYDSNLVHSHQSRHSYASIPRRLVYSSQLSRGSSPGSQYCSFSLSGVGGCGKPGINRTSSQLSRFNIWV